MPLSWNEIKNRAVAFSKEWDGESSEDAEAKSFWDNFFNVFGISRRRVASFEKPVKKGDRKQGFIDLLWKGVILVEHKSRGRDLDKAFIQAKDYFPGLKDEELPKYILVSDFDRLRLHDLEADTSVEFHLNEFVQHVHLFDFIAGYEKRVYRDEDPVNIDAAEKMGKLHDQLKAVGYTGHSLERYLVRLLFCLFADDTNIFEKGIFWQYIDLHTKVDGSDLAGHLVSIFHVLNTPKDQRLTNLDENLAQFPYVNGRLFEEALPPASFDSSMRNILLEACALDWGKISPAIFGSMFQAAMNPTQRRNLGAHYTSEKNIQKVIKPLFLDDLYSDFERAKGNKSRLNELHAKVARLRFLDPACGCGNFLIISYRELRQLEILILRELNKTGTGFLDVSSIIRVDVDQFYGIEYDEFPAMIAEVAMWLIDHQMNMKVSDEFGQYFVRLPLRKAAKITHGNALKITWTDLIPNDQLSYILGNPPFVGSKRMNENQRQELLDVFNESSDGAGVMDYVTAWYIKAAQYIQNTRIKVAFVSTNSVAQGEQVGILWSEMFNRYNIKIFFAHRTFKWSNEAKGNAAVYCVIIGFSNYEISDKTLYVYENIKGEPHGIKAKNINPYLVDGSDVLILKRSKPIHSMPAMSFGNMPLDGGFLLLDDNEKNNFISIEPRAINYLKPFIGAREFLNNKQKWCLWLVDVPPHELRSMPYVLERIEGVKKFRLASTAPSTQKFAISPGLFRDRNNPESFIVTPRVSSENRKYIPMGFFGKESIAGDTCMIIPNGSIYLFGHLTSEMHMAWVKYVCGRLKSDFRYSKDVVYNNYPFPDNVNENARKRVEEAAQRVLDIRSSYPSSSLADMYDSLSMPLDLAKAHKELDKSVDLCYRPQPFTNELNRIEFLFNLYEQISLPIFVKTKKK